MKNKKIIIAGIVFVLVIVAVVAIIVVNYKKQDEEPQIGDEFYETGAFYGGTITVEDYEIEIKSSEPGHPEYNSLFNTPVVIENYSANINSLFYNVNYEKLLKGSTEISNVKRKSKEIKINGKKFKYDIDKSQNTINLFYIIDDNAVLLINIEFVDAFNKDGSRYTGKITTNEDILKLKEIQGVINFNVKKIN